MFVPRVHRGKSFEWVVYRRSPGFRSTTLETWQSWSTKQKVPLPSTSSLIDDTFTFCPINPYYLIY